jgi:hypothetical protein
MTDDDNKDYIEDERVKERATYLERLLMESD